MAGTIATPKAKEYTALLNCIDRVVAEISVDPLVVANTLVVKRLIPSSLINSELLQGREKELKAREIVEMVCNKVETSPNCFEDFVSVLNEFSWLESVVKMIQKELDELSAKEKGEEMLKDCDTEQEKDTAVALVPVGSEHSSKNCVERKRSNSLQNESESLINDGILNKQACIKLFNNFLKLLQWYRAHRSRAELKCGEISAQDVMSQIICYTIQLMNVLIHPSSYIQLQAARLFQSKEALSFIQSVMESAPDVFNDDSTCTDSISALCIAFLDCLLLNCLSAQKPVEEVNPEDEHVLVFLLFKHLEDIPLENPQNMVKLILINSILNTLYWRIKWTSFVYCLPSEKFISAIATVASTYPVQVIRILAKSVLCLLWPHLVNKPHQAIVLDAVEIQTFLNILQSRATLYQALTFPICSYMEDLVTMSSENRVLFLKWYARETLLIAKNKCEDPALLVLFDKLMSLLTSTLENHIQVPMKILSADTTELHSDDHSDQNSEFTFLSETTFDWVDLLNSVTKYFIFYIQNAVLTSTSLSLPMINNITLTLGLIRHMIRDETMHQKILDFLSKEHQFFSVIHLLLEKWPELPDSFPIFGNSLYGCLISGSNYQDFCIELGRSGLLHRLLSFLHTVGVVGDILKFGDVGIVIGILMIIFNCSLHKKMILALEIVSTVNILPVFAQCPIIRVAMLAKFALSFMVVALRSLDVLVVTHEEISYISSHLSEAANHGSSPHGFTDLELLKVLANLTQDPRFSKNIIQIYQSNSVLSTITKFLSSNSLDVQNQALRLLLNFYSFLDQPSIHLIHGQDASTVTSALRAFCTSNENSVIQQLAACAQLLLDPNLKKNPEQVLLCVELCYKLNLWDKCVELCSELNIPPSSKLSLFQGKSLFHLYRKEQELYIRQQDTQNNTENMQDKSSCYKKAEECVKLLGTALDENYIDSEGSKLLDLAMLDCVRETTKLKRCLLCRRKGNLRKSHLWPRSFLRKYGNFQKKENSSKVFISFHSLRPKEKSAGELTYWMLCGECEQRISQNGEHQFASNFFDTVFSGAKSDNKVPYGPWLYDFSIGIVFRTFLYFGRGISKHYWIFQQCRKHLLALPVKYESHSTSSEFNQISKVSKPETSSVIRDTFNPGDAELQSASPISIVILANPTNLNNDHPRKSMLIGALFDAGSALLCSRSLTTSKIDLIGQHHFIVVRLGILSIILPLEASVSYCPPDGTVINPQGGELFVPGEEQRWSYIPEGLWAAIDITAKEIERTSLDHYIQRSRSGHWKNSLSMQEQDLPQKSKEFAEKERQLHVSLKEVTSSSPESSLVSGFLNTSYPSISFLPEEIKLIQRYQYTQKEFLRLPTSHTILLHHFISLPGDDSFTIFLVAKFEDDSPNLKTYIIFIECIRGVQLAYGAYISVGVDKRIHVTDSLIEMNKFSQYYVERFQYYCKVVEEIFPSFLKIKRYEHIETLILRAEVTRFDRVSLSFGPLDTKCKGVCWYCDRSCHHCMQPASAGFSLMTVDGTCLKFCNTNLCYRFYSEDPINIPAFVILPSRNTELLLQITKVISTNWSETTVVTIQLCIAQSSNIHGLDVGQLYVLIQFQTPFFRGFLDFSISDDFDPIDTLRYMQQKSSVLKFRKILLKLMLKLIIEDALLKTPFKTLNGLLQPQIKDNPREDTPCLAEVSVQRAARVRLTLEDLKEKTGVTHSQLNIKIITQDIYSLAGCFDDIEPYLSVLGLTTEQQISIMDLATQKNIQLGVAEALKLWCELNPLADTFRDLLEILLDVNKEDVVIKMCQYICNEVPKPKYDAF